MAFSKNRENLTTTDFIIFPSYAMDLPYKLLAEYATLENIWTATERFLLSHRSLRLYIFNVKMYYHFYP